MGEAASVDDSVLQSWLRKHISCFFSKYNVELADFVTADDIIETEDLSKKALAKWDAEEADSSDIDSDDDGPNLQLPIVSVITAVDVLRTHFVATPMGCQLLSQLDAMQAAIVKTNVIHRVRSHIEDFFRKE